MANNYTDFETRTVNSGFEFEGKDYWVVAEVDLDIETIPATWDDPAEVSYDVKEVRIEEVTVNTGQYEEQEIKVCDLEPDLREAIEEFCGEEAERG